MNEKDYIEGLENCYLGKSLAIPYCQDENSSLKKDQSSAWPFLIADRILIVLRELMLHLSEEGSKFTLELKNDSVQSRIRLLKV